MTQRRPSSISPQPDKAPDPEATIALPGARADARHRDNVRRSPSTARGAGNAGSAGRTAPTGSAGTAGAV